MRSVCLPALTACLFCACSTIQIPLPGTNIMRPRAGLSEVGARVSVGATTGPSVEGAIEEVKDSNGFVINPLPGEKDTAGNEIMAVSPLAAIELGVDWSKRYEFGISTSRGAFFMWDYALWDNAALTLTPSYSSLTREGGEPKFTTTVDEEGEERLDVDHSYKGTAQNFNVTQLGSVWVGSVKWAALYLYGGMGLNFFNAAITHTESGTSNKTSQVAPSALIGTHLRLLIFEVTTEYGATTIKYRDGTSKTVPTGGATVALHIAL